MCQGTLLKVPLTDTAVLGPSILGPDTGFLLHIIISSPRMLHHFEVDSVVRRLGIEEMVLLYE